MSFSWGAWGGMALLCISVMGCSSSDESSGGAGVFSAVPAERFCDEYVQITCEAAERCGCLENYSFDLCLSFQRAECKSEYGNRAISDRYIYDPGSAGQCIHGVQAVLADCSTDGDDYPVACDDMLKGAVAEGNACEDDDECVEPLSCRSAICTRLPMDGQGCAGGECADDHFCGSDDVCHRYRSVGGDCSEGSQACDDALYCDPRTNTCQPYLKEGQGCDHATWACDDDLRCESGSCRPYASPGQPCPDLYCADGAYCDDGGTCRAEMVDGAACGDDQECASGSCDNGVCGKTESDICSF